MSKELKNIPVATALDVATQNFLDIFTGVSEGNEKENKKSFISKLGEFELDSVMINLHYSGIKIADDKKHRSSFLKRLNDVEALSSIAVSGKYDYIPQQYTEEGSKWRSASSHYISFAQELFSEISQKNNPDRERKMFHFMEKFQSFLIGHDYDRTATLIVARFYDQLPLIFKNLGNEEARSLVKILKEIKKHGLSNDFDSLNSLPQTAVKNNDLKLLTFLHEAGFDLDKKNSLDETPLHLAIEGGKRDIIDYLLNAEDKALPAKVNVSAKNGGIYNAAKDASRRSLAALSAAGFPLLIAGSAPFAIFHAVDEVIIKGSSTLSEEMSLIGSELKRLTDLHIHNLFGSYHPSLAISAATNGDSGTLNDLISKGCKIPKESPKFVDEINKTIRIRTAARAAANSLTNLNSDDPTLFNCLLEGSICSIYNDDYEKIKTDFANKEFIAFIAPLVKTLYEETSLILKNTTHNSADAETNTGAVVGGGVQAKFIEFCNVVKKELEMGNKKNDLAASKSAEAKSPEKSEDVAKKPAAASIKIMPTAAPTKTPLAKEKSSKKSKGGSLINGMLKAQTHSTHILPEAPAYILPEAPTGTPNIRNGSTDRLSSNSKAEKIPTHS